MRIGQYRIVRPILALVEENGNKEARIVPVGDFITINTLPMETTNHVSVLWAGKPAVMYLRDLRQRAEFLYQN